MKKIISIVSSVTFLIFGLQNIVFYDIAKAANVSNSKTEYVLHDLGRGAAYEINDLGQITGRKYDAVTDRDRAFIWSKETGFTDLGPTVAGRAINNNGKIGLGGSIWSQEGGFTPVASPSEFTGITLHGINNLDQFTGYFHTSNGGYRAAFWENTENVTILPSLGGNDASSWAYGINDSGMVVGESNQAVDTDTRAAIWDNSGNVSIVPGTENNVGSAQDINNSGQIAGTYWVRDDLVHGFVYSPGTGLLDLGNLGTGRYSGSSAVNNNGWVAGHSMYLSGDSTYHAFVWNPVDGLIDLGALGGEESHGIDINSSNQVVGSFFDSSGFEHIALWEPVTKPTFNISGKVNLSDFGGSLATIPIDVEVRGIDTTTATITLQSDGSYTLSGLTNGFYDISFKGGHWLRKTITNVGVYKNTTVNVALINGDIDGDNNVDKQDQDLFKKANGSTPISRKWNANADLNGDNKVNRLDKAILEKNLGLSGDL